MPTVSPGESPHRAIILCPLQHEMKALRRAGLALVCDLHCTGPGSRGITQWFAAHPNQQVPVILAGLAGGVSERAVASAAYIVTRVIDGATGELFEPSIQFAANASPTIAITSLEQVLESPQGKRSLSTSLKADLVDLESVSFARHATAHGLSWAIVRAVSDDRDTALPRGIGDWVDSDGHTRLRPVLKAMLRQPSILPSLLRLARASRAGLRHLGELLEREFSTGRQG